MTQLTTEDFVRTLESLTDRERLDFAVWAAAQPNLTPTRLDWGRIYVGGSHAAVDAVRAFDSLRHDQTVSEAEGVWFFDPCFPQGWDAWRAAEAHIRAMTLAIQQRDAVALSLLAGAFDRIGLAGQHVPSSL